MFWVGVGLGWLVMGYGAWGLVQERQAAAPLAVARLFFGAAVLHDAVLAPVVFAAGFLVARHVPAWSRGPVQAGLLTSAVVALYSWPFVRGYGRAATNPSALPADYGRGLAVIVLGVWVLVAGEVFRRARARRREPAAPPGEGHGAS